MKAISKDEVLAEFRIERDDVNVNQRASVLDSDFLREWFLHHGYKTYIGCKDSSQDYLGFKPTISSEYSTSGSAFPYAHHEDNGADLDPPPSIYDTPFLAEVSPRVIFAQDSQQRHVAIKIVPDGSHEYTILRFLFEQGYPDCQEKFHYIIPVLDILPFEDFWFVVMPRWGSTFNRPDGPTIKQVLEIIHSLLKGLTYLHKNRIAHGDISVGNVLVNHFCPYGRDFDNPARISLRKRGQLTYALFDFDFSTKFPSSWSNKQCRLPYQKSYYGTPGFVPPDTWQGEFDYDPFAWDVGGLGLLLWGLFAHLTPHVPMLAPFLDRMKTRDIPRRFTAEQALGFLEDEVYPRTTPAQLSVKVGARPITKSDMWAKLDPTFIQEWAAYRETPLPWTTKFMRFICDYPIILRVVAFVRKNLHVIRELISLEHK